jgi:hypothetical protein
MCPVFSIKLNYPKLFRELCNVCNNVPISYIDADLAPILLRVGANSEAWVDTISHFESRFRLAAGFVSSLRSFAGRLGKRWFTGITAAQVAFAAAAQST